jgi:hypothetical protein
MNKLLSLLVLVAASSGVGCSSGDDERTAATDEAFSSTTWVTCESTEYRYNTCNVHGPIRYARIVRQLSSSRCDQGQSWGYANDYVWVDHGCRAEIEVVIDTGPPPPPCGVLRQGQSLYQGQSLWACNGSAYIAHQNDGNLVVYARDGRVLIANNVHDPSSNVLTMQSDGNLVEYSATGRALWASNTAGYYGAQLYMQDDCNVVLYHDGRPIWATHTDGCVPAH